MGAPKVAWFDGDFVYERGETIPHDGGVTKYIRSDLVEKLIGHAVHDDECNLNRAFSTKSCTCGLSDLIKEVRG